MQRQRTTTENVRGYEPSARATDTELSSESATPVRATVQYDTVTHDAVPTTSYKIWEAVVLTVVVALVTLAGSLLVSVTAALTSWLAFKFGYGIHWWFSLTNFLLTALITVTIGFLAGRLGNRKTITGSLIAAHLVSMIGWNIYMFIALPVRFRVAIWSPASIANTLFGVVTITLAQIAIAQYVARRYKK